jgi:S-formylglutathione hydrolase FrmB
MARTSIAVTDATAQPPTFILSNVAADAVNNNMFLNDGRTVLVVSNGSGGALTVTILSIADKYGRSDTVFTSFSLPAGATRFFGPFPQSVWNQVGSDIGNVYVNPSSASLGVSAIRLAAHGSTP